VSLLEQIEQLRLADPNDMISRLLGTVLRKIVDAEATAHIGGQHRGGQ
jgi:transposase-like protein